MQTYKRLSEAEKVRNLSSNSFLFYLNCLIYPTYMTYPTRVAISLFSTKPGTQCISYPKIYPLPPTHTRAHP